MRWGGLCNDVCTDAAARYAAEQPTRVVTRLERRCLSNTWRNWVSYCGSRRRSRRVVMAWLKRVDALHLMYGFARWREYVLLTTAGAVRLVRTHLPDC